MKKTVIEVIVLEVIFLTIFIGISVIPSEEFYPQWSKWASMWFSGGTAVGVLIYYVWFRYVKHGK